ncbi:hypothetical protein Tco_0199514 [Tanacetum coccineum]|uniref:Uncharacterized protein n=1 Tax=Tanacetum coccineum TaxID=301880 RepID=A0ABQ4X342_9ASTR
MAEAEGGRGSIRPGSRSLVGGTTGIGERGKGGKRVEGRSISTEIGSEGHRGTGTITRVRAESPYGGKPGLLYKDGDGVNGRQKRRGRTGSEEVASRGPEGTALETLNGARGAKKEGSAGEKIRDIQRRIHSRQAHNRHPKVGERRGVTSHRSGDEHGAGRRGSQVVREGLAGTERGGEEMGERGRIEGNCGNRVRQGFRWGNTIIGSRGRKRGRGAGVNSRHRTCDVGRTGEGTQEDRRDGRRGERKIANRRGAGEKSGRSAKESGCSRGRREERGCKEVDRPTKTRETTTLGGSAEKGGESLERRGTLSIDRTEEARSEKGELGATKQGDDTKVRRVSRQSGGERSLSTREYRGQGWYRRVQANQGGRELGGNGSIGRGHSSGVDGAPGYGVPRIPEKGKAAKEDRKVARTGGDEASERWVSERRGRHRNGERGREGGGIKGVDTGDTQVRNELEETSKCARGRLGYEGSTSRPVREREGSSDQRPAVRIIRTKTIRERALRQESIEAEGGDGSQYGGGEMQDSICQH